MQSFALWLMHFSLFTLCLCQQLAVHHISRQWLGSTSAAHHVYTLIHPLHSMGCMQVEELRATVAMDISYMLVLCHIHMTALTLTPVALIHHHNLYTLACCTASSNHKCLGACHCFDFFYTHITTNDERDIVLEQSCPHAFNELLHHLFMPTACQLYHYSPFLYMLSASFAINST